MKTIHITQEDQEQAEEFAALLLPTVVANYRNRNQCNPNKILEDVITGHLGEIAWYKHFNELGYNVSPVNNEIYVSAKSWAPDLTIDDQNIHIKTQESRRAETYGISWTFQKADKNGNQVGRHSDPLITNPQKNDWIALCVRRMHSVELIAFFPALLAREKDLWQEPMLAYLKKSKAVIYLSDLEVVPKALWSVE